MGGVRQGFLAQVIIGDNPVEHVRKYSKSQDFIHSFNLLMLETKALPLLNNRITKSYFKFTETDQKYLKTEYLEQGRLIVT
jgi:hypothetical protein